MTEREYDILGADLSAYLDGELSEQRRREVEQLLVESAEARHLRDELRGVSDRLAALPRLRAPDEVAASLARYAERRLLSEAQAAQRRSRTLRLFTQVTAAAAVLVACVLIGYQVVGRPRSTEPGLAKAPHRIALEKEVASPKLMATGTTAEHLAAKTGSPATVAPAAGGAAARTRAMKSEPPAPVHEPEAELPGTERAESGGADYAFAVAPQPAADTARAAPPVAAEEAAVDIPGDETPTVAIVIRTRDEREYLASAATLADWSRRGSFAADKPGTPPADSASAAQRPIEQVYYQVPAGELAWRIDQLARNVQTPNQVVVDLRFNAARSDILVLTGAGGAGPAGEAAAQVRGGAPAVAAYGKLGAGAAVSKDRQPPAAGAPPAPEAAAAPASPTTPSGTEGPAARRAAKPIVGGRGAPPGPRQGGRAGEAPEGAQGIDDRRDEETKARELHRRHVDATAEPVIIIVPEPPASEPAGVGGPPSSQPSPTSEPTPQPVQQDNEAAARPPPPSLVDRLLELWFPSASGTGDNTTKPDERSAGTPAVTEWITFRVTLLPPAAAPTSAPASQPATRPADQP